MKVYRSSYGTDLDNSEIASPVYASLDLGRRGKPGQGIAAVHAGGWEAPGLQLFPAAKRLYRTLAASGVFALVLAKKKMQIGGPFWGVLVVQALLFGVYIRAF